MPLTAPECFDEPRLVKVGPKTGPRRFEQSIFGDRGARPLQKQPEQRDGCGTRSLSHIRLLPDAREGIAAVP